MNKQQIQNNPTRPATAVNYEIEQSRSDICAQLDKAPEKFIAEPKLDAGPVYFRNANDVKTFMIKTGQVPVVKKRKAKPRSDRKHHAADDYFELVESFNSYEQAQQFIEGKLSLLIWSVPITTPPKGKKRARHAA